MQAHYATPLAAAEQDIPAPSERFIRLLAAQAFEVVEGIRSVAQLGAHVSIGAARSLSTQRAAMQEARQVHRDQRNYIPIPGQVRICRVLPRIVEASAVLHTEQRSHAVAIRLEWAHERWRACELYVM